MNKNTLIQALTSPDSLAKELNIPSPYVENLLDVLERITNRLEQTTKTYMTISFDRLDADFVSMAFDYLHVAYTRRLIRDRIELTVKF